MASPEGLGDEEGPGAMHRVPLEPYPAPPFQAIDQQGYEYPPRLIPPAQAFEAMVQRLDLMRHATKRRRRSRWGGAADAGRVGKGSPTEEAEQDVGAALQAVEEAMQDLLIAADLVHVVRGGKGSANASFIGQDKLADASVLAAAGRMFQGGRALASLQPRPVAHIPPDVVLGMKQRALSEAAHGMAQWVHATRESLSKGRRLLGEMVGLRRRARLRAGLRNAVLPRPLSAGDALSVRLDTARGPVVLPFETEEETGAPRLLGLGGGDEEWEAEGEGRSGYGVLRVSVVDGWTGARAAVTVGGSAMDGGLAGAVRALEAEARLGRLFAALQREASAPQLAWVDRHGLLLPSPSLPTPRVGEGVVVKEEEAEEAMGRGDKEGHLRVVRCGEGSVMVEAGPALVLQVELLGSNGTGGGLHGRQHEAAAAPAPTAADDDGPLGWGLRDLCRLAAVRLLELGGPGGADASSSPSPSRSPPSILGQVAALVAHRWHVRRLLAAVTRVAGKSRREEGGRGEGGVMEAVRWVEYPFSTPRSRVLLQGSAVKAEGGEGGGGGVGGAPFTVDVAVEGLGVVVLWADGERGGERVVELGRVKDVESFLERRLLRLSS